MLGKPPKKPLPKPSRASTKFTSALATKAAKLIGSGKSILGTARSLGLTRELLRRWARKGYSPILSRALKARARSNSPATIRHLSRLNANHPQREKSDLKKDKVIKLIRKGAEPYNAAKKVGIDPSIPTKWAETESGNFGNRMDEAYEESVRAGLRSPTLKGRFGELDIAKEIKTDIVNRIRKGSTQGDAAGVWKIKNTAMSEMKKADKEFNDEINKTLDEIEKELLKELEELYKKAILTKREIEGVRAGKRGVYIRRLRMKLARLPDTDNKLIKEFYILARELTVSTGIKHVVDHVLPLSIGGAHDQRNLQVITKEKNDQKSDIYDPELYPEQLNGKWARYITVRETRERLGMRGRQVKTGAIMKKT